MLDAAHNPDGAAALAWHVRSLGLPPSDVALVFGTLADKSWEPMLDILAPLAAERRYVAPEGVLRGAADPVAMAARHPGAVERSTARALAAYAASAELAVVRGVGPPQGRPHGSPSLVVVAGSIVLVGEARGLLLDLPRDPPVAL